MNIFLNFSRLSERSKGEKIALLSGATGNTPAIKKTPSIAPLFSSIGAASLVQRVSNLNWGFATTRNRGGTESLNVIEGPVIRRSKPHRYIVF